MHDLCQETELSLIDAYEVSVDGKIDKRMMPKVLSGITLSFGNDIGYFLPLPSPLPYISSISKLDTSQSSFIPAKKACIEDLPFSCKELISRFVGYRTIMRKTAFKPRKDNLFLKGRSAGSSFGSFSSIVIPPCTDKDRNPLLLVSKSWMKIARKGLLSEVLKKLYY
jgi:hypothetical protein